MAAVNDNFTRANAATLGAAWTAITGVWEIVSNRCQNNTDAGGLGYYARFESDVGSSDLWAQAVVTSVQASANSNTGVALRQRVAANTSYQVTGRHAADTISFWRIVAGAETQLISQAGTSTLPVVWGSGDTIRGEAVGQLIRAKINGQVVGFAKDATITDGQRVGLNGWNEIASDVVEVDDWAGGALVADGGLVGPYLVGVSDQVTATTGTVTPTVPPVIAAGDLVVVQTTSRDAAQTMTAPAGEGWSSLLNPSQTGLEDVLWAKVWGLGGQTDDTTPTFSIGSGTAGWGATAAVWRNPSHGSLPWTSVAAAVLASASSANASNATVSTPSATHTGTHRTTARFCSSADDNDVRTNQHGGLVYGGANYDSVTGNDFSQACSVLEDVTVTTNTGTSTFAQVINGPDVSNGMTIVIGIPSGVLGLPAETDTATGIVFAAKSTALGGPSAETDSAPVLVFALKSTGVALASDVESAPAIAAATKSRTVGIASTTDTSVALAGASKTSSPLGRPSSAESAVALAGASHATNVAAAPETDTGPPLAAAEKATTVGAAAGTETAVGLAGAEKRTALGVATEIDQAPPLAAAALGAGSETDTVPGLAAAAKTTLLGLATSLEQAIPLAGQVKLGPVGTAVEVDTARELIVIPDDLPSQGSYDSGSGPLVYDGTSSRVYDPAAGRLIYDP